MKSGYANEFPLEPTGNETNEERLAREQRVRKHHASNDQETFGQYSYRPSLPSQTWVNRRKSGKNMKSGKKNC